MIVGPLLGIWTARQQSPVALGSSSGACDLDNLPAVPRIGIVVPAYNTGSFLGPTVESIRTQSFRDWHCVLVDDGSTDGTADRCDAAAARDRRFSVIHQQNAGISAARNAGL